jgi:hypothetical protein
MRRVVVHRTWAGGDVWWSNRYGWVRIRAFAETFKNALKCPDILPLGEHGQVMVRRASEYWAGDMRWATVEWAHEMPPGGEQLEA